MYPVFFILWTERVFEILPKDNGIGLILESFAWNLIISVPLTNK